VVGMPDYGSSVVRPDGSFAIAVNGGDPVTIAVHRSGYLSAYRQVQTHPNRYAFAQDVVLQPLAPTQLVSSSASTTTVVAGEVETDGQGTRSAALFFPSGTHAIVDGEADPRLEFDVRVQEMTNTDRFGHDGMPASLPPQVAFTYLVSMTVD